MVPLELGWGRPAMWFVFCCWDCEEDNELWGERVGFWGTRFEVDSEWTCWNCGALNATHDPPWTEA
jgi:hypothetical protein